MAAAVFAAEAGAPVLLFEQNEKLGKKLYITGKGRCNFTNGCGADQLSAGVVSNPKFLYSAFHGFDNRQAVSLFERLGVPVKMERGLRYFPQSDHSSDIIRALERRLLELGAEVHLRTKVKSILFRSESSQDGEKRSVRGILLENGREIPGDCVILASGGLSYPATGASGDGYRMAADAGHRTEKQRPALVPLVTAEDYITRMQGLSLRNVVLSVFDGKKKLFSEFGEMLFTHFGISGPLALSASSYIGKKLEQHPLPAEIDLKPALSIEQLSARLLREFEAAGNKTFRNILPALLPAKMVPVVTELSGIPGEKRAHDITREDRERTAGILKRFPMTITDVRGYNEAIITQGGISVKEVNPATMESKLAEGLYFAGEVLDLDAVTGGFNLQIAWSTAHAAACAAAKKCLS